MQLISYYSATYDSLATFWLQGLLARLAAQITYAEEPCFGFGPKRCPIFVRDESGHVKEMIYDVGIFKLTAKKIK